MRRQSPLAHMRPKQWRGQCAAGRAKHSKAAAQHRRREGGWISPVVQTMGRAALPCTSTTCTGTPLHPLTIAIARGAKAACAAIGQTSTRVNRAVAWGAVK